MQTIIDVKVTNINGLRIIDAKINGSDKVIKSTIFNNEITDVDSLVTWLLAQPSQEQVTSTNLQKRLTIDHHIDGFGETIVDNIVSESLPVDSGRTNFEATPGWATWTANEAESWINTNVVDLPSAIVALKAMAKTIIFLRDITV